MCRLTTWLLQLRQASYQGWQACRQRRAKASVSCGLWHLCAAYTWHWCSVCAGHVRRTCQGFVRCAMIDWMPRLASGIGMPHTRDNNAVINQMVIGIV